VLSVTESWDDADPSRPKTMGFVGSEEYIRLQFEEYILSMISAVKYHLYLERNAAAGNTGNYALPEIGRNQSSISVSQQLILNRGRPIHRLQPGVR
jgi:hypothetical protein